MQPIDTLIRDKGGFRQRGEQITRLGTFVDAAFAFAVTMLVISIAAIPDSFDALALALKGIPAFAASFIMIAMFWSAHANWSHRFGLDDGASKVLSLALVFLVLVYIYPLRIQFGVLFAGISGGWLPFPIKINSTADLSFMFLVYGLAFATMSLCLFGLYVHAWRCRKAIGLDAGEVAATAGEMAAYAYFVTIGLLSAVLSACMADSRSAALISLPGMAYFLLSFTGLLASRVKRRVEARNAGA